jgi:myo-inositol-1(or 4)-monophosphatase
MSKTLKSAIKRILADVPVNISISTLLFDRVGAMRTLEDLYSRLTDLLVTSGDRIHLRAGDIADIGMLKRDLTEEDIRIERETSNLILTEFPIHTVFAEEEHDRFQDSDDVWVIDPISGTAAYIAGIPHYGLVVTHVHKNEPQFSAVYDPSSSELYVAEKGKGASLNGRPIHISNTTETVIVNLAKNKINTPQADLIWAGLRNFQAYRYAQSFAVNYCWVAAGRFDGVVALTKDAFPEYAGWLMIKEAGGKFTSRAGGSVRPADRSFLGGNFAMYDKLVAASP